MLDQKSPVSPLGKSLEAPLPETDLDILIRTLNTLVGEFDSVSINIVAKLSKIKQVSTEFNEVNQVLTKPTSPQSFVDEMSIALDNLRIIQKRISLCYSHLSELV